ncbi:MAG TPA: helix-turn-helix transcriptional regulator [Acidimicrobiales bacterium]|nr:helix-turn-helix transcriptional regulator [Acidimicrobiales bacterium]
MAAYESQARLLRVWRTDIAGLRQAEVAELLSTNKATVSMWEHAKRGITFEALNALDDRYDAGGALADMAQALGTPAGLPPRRTWTRYPSGAYGTGWAWLRPGPGQDRVDATLTWGPIPLACSQPCDAQGILLQFPIAAPDVVVTIRLAEPGWVDFGRSEAAPELGIPVHAVPSSPALTLGDVMPAGLVSPRLAQRFDCHPAFAAAISRFFGARPDLVRRAFAARPSLTDAPGGLTVDRPHDDRAVPCFTNEQYRALRHGRCLTLADAAALATKLLPDEPVSADRVRRFERGATPQARQLRARLDHVYEAGGYTCNEPVHVKDYRPPFTVTFPRYWVGPVWFAFGSDGRAPTEVRVRHGGVHQDLVVVPGASVACTRPRPDDDAFRIELPYGWRVTAGLGARPDAPEIRFATPAVGGRDDPTPRHVHDDLLSLFGRTPKELEHLLQHYDPRA